MASYRYTVDEIIKNYERLIKKEQKRNNELQKEMQKLVLSFETVKITNKDIVLNTEILKNDNLILRDYINILYHEMQKIKSNKNDNEINTNTERDFVNNKDYCFIIYKIDEKNYYHVFGNKESIKNQMENMVNTNVMFCDTDSNYGIELYQFFKEENKKELEFLKNGIISILKIKIPNFDPSYITHKKIILEIFNKNKGFEIIDNKIILNKSTIEDVIDSYGKMKKKMNDISLIIYNFR